MMILDFFKSNLDDSKSKSVKKSQSKVKENESSHQNYSYEQIKSIADFISSQTTIKPKVGIICGSGLNGLTESMENNQTLMYKDIPNFPQPTVAGHEGILVLGLLSKVPVVAMKGRFHPYEGHEPWKCGLPVRVMKLLGVDVLIVTNAAGGLNDTYQPGDIMIIKDHISLPGLSGSSPLIGANDERWGPRFPALNGAYDKQLIASLESVGQQLNLSQSLRKGVYCMVGGPCYETVAECKLLRLLGADAVGMSTIHEVTMGVHCGLKVLGISLITNSAIMDEDDNQSVNHQEVLQVAGKSVQNMEALIKEFIVNLSFSSSHN